jgi:hypothetical protein
MLSSGFRNFWKSNACWLAISRDVQASLLREPIESRDEILLLIRDLSSIRWNMDVPASWLPLRRLFQAQSLRQVREDVAATVLLFFEKNWESIFVHYAESDALI